MKTIHLSSSVCCLKVRGLIDATTLIVVFHLSSTIICLILINLSHTVKETFQFNRQIKQGQPNLILVNFSYNATFTELL